MANTSNATEFDLRNPDQKLPTLVMDKEGLIDHFARIKRAPELRSKLAAQFTHSDALRIRLSAAEKQNDFLCRKLEETSNALAQYTSLPKSHSLDAAKSVMLSTLGLVLPINDYSGLDFKGMLSKKGMLVEDLIVCLYAQNSSVLSATEVSQAKDVTVAMIINTIDGYLNTLESPALDVETKSFIASFLMDSDS